MNPRKTRLLPVLFACTGLALGTAAHAALTISQKGKIFNPETLDAKSGEALRIPNDDDVAHNLIVTSPSGAKKNYGLQKPGEVTEVALDQAGTFLVRCGIHPRMKLSVEAK